MLYRYLHVHTLDDLHVDLNLLAELEQLPGCIDIAQLKLRKKL